MGKHIKISFKSRLRYFFRYQFILPFKAIYYFFYFMKYPFWQPRNVWTGKKYWTFSEYDLISLGWRKAFGKQLTNDLKEVLKKSKQLKSFYFVQIKEKWGALVLDPCSTTEEVYDLLHYYEHLSICYCEDCGRQARYKRLGGWVGYVCADCFSAELENLHPGLPFGKKYKIKVDHRLKVKDIPTIEIYDKTTQTYKKDNRINYRKMWALDNRRANINVNGRKEIQK